MAFLAIYNNNKEETIKEGVQTDAITVVSTSLKGIKDVGDGLAKITFDTENIEIPTFVPDAFELYHKGILPKSTFEVITSYIDRYERVKNLLIKLSNLNSSYSNLSEYEILEDISELEVEGMEDTYKDIFNKLGVCERSILKLEDDLIEVISKTVMYAHIELPFKITVLESYRVVSSSITDFLMLNIKSKQDSIFMNELLDFVEGNLYNDFKDISFHGFNLLVKDTLFIYFRYFGFRFKDLGNEIVIVDIES